MAVFGWLCLLAGLVMLSAGYYLAALNNLGTYNIGGVPNTTAKKVATIFGAVFLVALWVLLIESAPFTVTAYAG
jgi:hypothetical protein